MDPAFTELEESFFREGDTLSAVPEEILDSPSWSMPVNLVSIPINVTARIDVASYYASLAVTIESDECSGGVEAAA